VVSSRKKLAVFSRFTLLFLGLAFCVFSWGLQYKLSLYDPPQAVSHTIPEAKLLSKDGMSATSENPLIQKASVFDRATRITQFSFLFLFVLALRVEKSALPLRKVTDTNEPWHLCNWAGLCAFFFRPPPALG